MSDSKKTRLTLLEHMLTIVGATLVGIGWLAVFADGTIIHPLLANEVLAWALFVGGLALSAGVSMHLVLRIRRNAQSSNRTRSRSG